MPLLLRTIRRNRWLKAEAEPFLARDDVPADPVGDLLTQQNALSVWEVADDRSNVERIVRAVAIGRDKISHMDYMLFRSELLGTAEIPVIETRGKTLDEEANLWHRDLLVSGNKLVALTKAMLLHGETGVVLKKRLSVLVEQGIRDGQLPERLQSKL